MTRLPGLRRRLRRRLAAPAPTGHVRVPLAGTPAPPISGLSPSGDLYRPGQADGLVLFMTSSCLACREVWAALNAGAPRSLPGRPAVLVVTPDPALESRRQVAALAGSTIDVVMSTEAWQAYRAGPAPWVAMVSDGMVLTEGPASSWSDVEAMAAR
ncbi:hypothetical protein K6U06_10970 [Acidiferrimicrobium sp. IK]|uniref:hypothetical protein n=1 Tax=Acidiferrimicrobium sp. IK TaxID=2871700 RepID=UPI0021CB62F0|nr:hypothetical protein [Acidiferrimicrobium sp. IK]MCU4184882.1 hypothetical protein [Acidiferrimicrobium sp. IK]